MHGARRLVSRGILRYAGESYLTVPLCGSPWDNCKVASKFSLGVCLWAPLRFAQGLPHRYASSSLTVPLKIHCKRPPTGPSKYLYAHNNVNCANPFWDSAGCMYAHPSPRLRHPTFRDALRCSRCRAFSSAGPMGLNTEV